MESPFTLTILLIILTFLSAIFSCTEAGYIALNKIRLSHMREKKARGSERVFNLVSHMDELITTILILNNLVNTAIASIAAIVAVRYFGPEWGVVISTVVVTIILLIFCETTPKIFATNHPEFVAFGFRHAASFFVAFFRPIVVMVTGLANGMIRIMGGTPRFRKPLASEEEIKFMIRVGTQEGYYGDNERRMLERIFHFDEIDVLEVMTPADKMAAINIQDDEEEILNRLMEQGHNRIPVYDGNVNNLIGILYVHDLLYLIKNSQLIKLRDLLNEPFFVTPDKKVSVLMREFQSKKIQIAIVRSKNDVVMGLVTLEDLLEEIVGEIEEETYA